MTLTPHDTFAALRPGSVLCVDFHGAVLRVVEAGTDRARAVVERGGRIGSNKGVFVDPASLAARVDGEGCRRHRHRPAHGHRGLCPVVRRLRRRRAPIRELIPPTAHLISKIESRAGVRNMDEIIEASDAVLIDRGDLSREVPLEEVPYYQKAIVRRANRWHKPLYVATNLLESMVLNNRPTIAEVNDIANTLLDGAHGLVLAAETAIGVDPVGAVDMVRRAIDTFEREALGRLVEPMVAEGGRPPPYTTRRTSPARDDHEFGAIG